MFRKSKPQKSVVAYQCELCGKIHGDPPKYYVAEPQYVSKLNNEDKAKAFVMKSGRCELVVGSGNPLEPPKRVGAILAELRIPIIGTKENLIWGLWVNVSEEEYGRFSRTQDGDQSDMETDGIIMLNLPCYVDDADQVKLECRINFGGIRKMPRIRLKPSDQLICRHQQKGVTIEMARELIEDNIHPF